MLKICNVSFQYQKGHPLISHINITLGDTGLVFLTGASGTGKTTLLSLIRGTLIPNQGDIYFNHKSLKKMNVKEQENYRLFDCHMVYQENKLFEDLSIAQNFAMLQECSSLKATECTSFLNKVHLRKNPETLVAVLSGGEKQRVNIARSLVFDPSIILLDEPTSALDDENAQHIIELLKEISQKSLVIVVTHDTRFINQYADYHYEIKDGKVHLCFKNEVSISSYPHFNIVHNRKNPLHFLLTYAQNKLKFKKKRTTFSIFFLSINMMFGLISVTVIESMKEQLINSFKPLTNNSQFQMYIPENLDDNRYSVNLEYATRLQDNIKDIEDIVTYYNNDLSSFFKDRNECRLLVENTPTISGIRWQEINNFKLLKERHNPCYPFTNNLENDEMIIGVPPFLMERIGYYLGIITPTYEKIGQYLNEHYTSLVFYAKNIDWDYENEEIFHFFGIVESESPCIYHTNNFFNEYVFEARMKLLSNLSWYEENEFPWTLNKQYLALTKVNLDDLLFSHPIYHTCLVDEVINEGSSFLKYSLSYNNSRYIKKSVIQQILNKEKHITGVIYGSDCGYQIINESIVQGMPGYLYLFNNKEELENNLDGRKENSIVAFNSILEPTESTFQISSKKEYQGLFGVSSLLAEELHLEEKKSVYCLYISNENEKVIIDCQVDYIVDAPIKNIYVDNNWLNNILKKTSHITSSKLRPRNVTFFVDNQKEIDSIMKECQKLYEEYTFSSSISDFNYQINKSMASVKIVLAVLLMWMIIFTSQLMKITHQLYMLEIKKDTELMVNLGMGVSSPFKVSSIIHFLLFIKAFLWSFGYYLVFLWMSKQDFLSSMMPFSLTYNVKTIIYSIVFMIIIYLFTFPFSFLFSKRKR